MTGERVDGSSGSLVAHLDLLSAAHRVQAAAVADDRAELLAAVEALEADLCRHITAERQQEQRRLPPAVREVVWQGQDRLVELVAGISRAAATDQRCSCLARSAEVAAALRRQAAVEAAAATHLRATARRRRHRGPTALR